MNKSMSTVFYGNDEIRTAVIDKEIWWAIIDVCKAIGVKNSRDLYKRLDDDEKKTLKKGIDGVVIHDTAGRKNTFQIINESGLYHLLFLARSEKAKPFRRWVTHEVLPRIRKYGYYKLTISERKTNAINSITKLLGFNNVSELNDEYDKMPLSYLESCAKDLKYEIELKKERDKILEKFPYTWDDIESFGIDIGLAETNIKAMGENLEQYKTTLRDEEFFNDKFVKRCKKVDAVLDNNLYRTNYKGA